MMGLNIYLNKHWLRYSTVYIKPVLLLDKHIYQINVQCIFITSILGFLLLEWNLAHFGFDFAHYY